MRDRLLHGVYVGFMAAVALVLAALTQSFIGMTPRLDKVSVWYGAVLAAFIFYRDDTGAEVWHGLRGLFSGQRR